MRGVRLKPWAARLWRAVRLRLRRSLGPRHRGRVLPGLLLGPTLSLRWRRSLGLSRAAIGAAGEALAARALAQAGARVRGRRVRTRWAEVDLVACLGDRLLLVEVKTASPPGTSSRPPTPGATVGTALRGTRPASSVSVHAAPPARAAPDSFPDWPPSWATPAGSRITGLVPPWSQRPARGLGLEQRRRLELAGRAARRSWGGAVHVLLVEVLLDHGDGGDPLLHWTELLSLP